MFSRTENLRQFLVRYPLLSIIIALNTAAFLYTYLRFGSEQIGGAYMIGGMLPDALQRGEPWRFVTYAFLHAGFTHYLMNMAFLLIVAPPLEWILGRTKFVLLFIVSVLSTSILVYVAGNQAGVGVSGFCYGVLGTFAVMALRRKDVLDRSSAQIVWAWIVVGWVGTLLIPGISVLGHLGGFLGGLLFGLAAVGAGTRLTPWVPVPPKRRGQHNGSEQCIGENGSVPDTNQEERRHGEP